MITQRNEQLILHADEIDGAFFDLDGTLIHNADEHYQAWSQFAASYGIPFEQSWFIENCTGKSTPQVLELLFQEELSDEQCKAFYNERFHIFEGLLRQTGQELPGTTDFLRRLRQAKLGRGVKRAVVTGGSRPTRELQLEVLGLEPMFDLVVGAEDTKREHAKPHPAPYQLAMSRLAVEASRGIAFEDSPTGVASAVGAGLSVVGVLTTHSAEQLPGISASIRDYTEITVI